MLLMEFHCVNQDFDKSKVQLSKDQTMMNEVALTKVQKFKNSKSSKKVQKFKKVQKIQKVQKLINSINFTTIP